MIKTARRYVNPIPLGLIGWASAIIANVVAIELSLRLIHFDQITIGLVFATMVTTTFVTCEASALLSHCKREPSIPPEGACSRGQEPVEVVGA